jgi:tRNA nucleotidyltransferase (CCA-adding enzyme)
MTRIVNDAIPQDAIELCEELARGGHAAYLVGGGVRDLLRGQPVKDWDVATSAQPHQVQQMFRRTIPTGIAHGTVTVLFREHAIEVTTFRGEGAYSDGRRPDSVHFVSQIEDDLGRRDLTINAIAFDPVTQTIVDPFSGQRDLEQGLIRAVGDPLARFEEDGLRVLRAIRFATVLRFQIDPETLRAMEDARVLERFKRVSVERVREELWRLLAADRPSIGIELMRHCGLLSIVLPELTETIGVRQNRHHSEDVYRHSLLACDAVRGGVRVRLAALLHDIGKPPTAQAKANAPGENTFYGHDRFGASQCDRVAERLRLSNADREHLTHLVRHHLFAFDQPSTDAAIRRFIQRVGRETLDDLFELRRADCMGRTAPEEKLAALEAFRVRVDQVLAEAPPLTVGELAIGGREVIARLGLGPGPRVGQILRELLQRVIDEPSLNRRKALLELVDELRDKSQ